MHNRYKYNIRRFNPGDKVLIAQANYKDYGTFLNSIGVVKYVGIKMEGVQTYLVEIPSSGPVATEIRVYEPDLKRSVE